MNETAPLEIAPITEPGAILPDLEQPDPCVIVLFGAGGDLTKRLVVPALYNLSRTSKLPENFALIGVDLAAGDTATWHKNLRDMLQSFVGRSTAELSIGEIDEEGVGLAGRPHDLHAGRPDQAGPLRRHRDRPDRDRKAARHRRQRHLLPRHRRPLLRYRRRSPGPGRPRQPVPRTATAARSSGAGWSSKKPFGHDLASAKALNAQIRRVLNEDQIFRIDHFLGKEAVQSIMAFPLRQRPVRADLEPRPHRPCADHRRRDRRGRTARQVLRGHRARCATWCPTICSRCSRWSRSNRLLASTPTPSATRRPSSTRAIKAIEPSNAVRGQYGPGSVGGKPVNAYRTEPNVGPDSNMETYVALELAIDNWRWAGVPFFLRTGKHMSRRETEIAIRFKPAPYAAFQNTPVGSLPPNWLVLRIAPDEGISLQFEVKQRGADMELAAVKMDFPLRRLFSQNAQCRLRDADPRRDERRPDAVHCAPTWSRRPWRIVEPVLDFWSKDKADFPQLSIRRRRAPRRPTN